MSFVSETKRIKLIENSDFEATDYKKLYKSKLLELAQSRQYTNSLKDEIQSLIDKEQMTKAEFSLEIDKHRMEKQTLDRKLQFSMLECENLHDLLEQMKCENSALNKSLISERSCLERLQSRTQTELNDSVINLKEQLSECKRKYADLCMLNGDMTNTHTTTAQCDLTLYHEMTHREEDFCSQTASVPQREINLCVHCKPRITVEVSTCTDQLSTDNNNDEHECSFKQKYLLAEQHISRLKTELQDGADKVRLSEIMVERISKFDQIQQKNQEMSEELSILRNAIDKSIILEEDNEYLKGKLEHLKHLPELTEQLRVDLDESNKELDKWRSVADNVHELQTCVSRLKANNLVFKSESIEHQSRADQLSRDLSEKCTEHSNCLQSLHTAQQQCTDQMSELASLNTQLSRVTMERDRLLDSLNFYESRIPDTLKETSCVTTVQTSSAGSSDRDSNELENCRKQCVHLQCANERLEQRLRLVLAQSSVPADQRVVSLTRFPSTDIVTLRQENKQLQSELQKLRLAEKELRSASTCNDSASGTQSDEITKLRASLRAAEQRAERHIQVFERSTRQFRKNVSCVTGYKISADSDTLSASSIYSGDPSLCFKFNIRDNRLDLLETRMSAVHSDLMEKYLWRLDSLPGFLASVTLHLLEGARVPRVTEQDERATSEPLDEIVLLE